MHTCGLSIRDLFPAIKFAAAFFVMIPKQNFPDAIRDKGTFDEVILNLTLIIFKGWILRFFSLLSI